MTNTLKRNLALLWLLLWVQVAVAQGVLKSPAQFLGYPLGEQFTTHSRILDYVNYLADQAPNRMKVQPYG